ncbi:MAG TPA: TadE/TadG family type IV pilus assembly protein [Acetobacteraceae bacterium]|jgi:Flp pilus assembly protein TadG|nr:TadE/TadG family type IV pilus assembly protein [Acetobacteraceae bacterium]
MLKAGRAVRKLLAERRATTALEFAMVALPLLLVSIATIELGLIIWTKSALQAVAADAARCGAISGPQCTGTNTISSFVQTEAANWVLGAVLSSTSHPLTVNVNGNVNTAICPPMTVGNYETVQIETSFFTLAANWLPPPFDNITIDVCASFAT